MRLTEIVDILKSTELKQIVVGEDDVQVLSLLNLALIDVYSKFNILQEEQVITIKEGVTRYTLQDNSQAVMQVFCRNLDENPPDGYDAYEEVPINDINCDESVFTPQPYILHVPNPDVGKEYSVIQSVSPPYITVDNVNTVDFLIPPQLMEPLVNYVGYRAYISMNGDEQAESSSHYRRYMRSVQDVQKRGLVHYTILTNTKTTDRGFR